MLRPYTTLGRLSFFCPRHHRPQLRSDLLDRVLPRATTELGEATRATTRLRNPLARERAALNLLEDLLHLGLHLRAHDARPPRVVAILRRVADGVAHELHAAAVHQIHDELQLVQALEVGDLR